MKTEEKGVKPQMFLLHGQYYVSTVTFALYL